MKSRDDATLHYTTLIALHYTTPHYTQLHYTTLHYPTPHCITLHYTTLITPPQMQLQLHYTNYITSQLQLQLRYTTLHPAVVGEVTDQVTRSNHLSVHQWIRSAIRDSQQPISPIGFLCLKLPPPPCAVLLVRVIVCHNAIYMSI